MLQYGGMHQRLELKKGEKGIGKFEGDKKSRWSVSGKKGAFTIAWAIVAGITNSAVEDRAGGHGERGGGEKGKTKVRTGIPLPQWIIGGGDLGKCRRMCRREEGGVY